MLAELHCLARGSDAPGWRPPVRPVPASRLRLVHLVQACADFDATIPGLPAPARRDADPSEVVHRLEGPPDAIRARWEQAACALPLLNRALEAADAAYPPVDSHSALATLGEWMGLQAPPPWPGRPAEAASALPPIRPPEGSAPSTLFPSPAPMPAVATVDPWATHPLYPQARSAVERMEDGIGRAYDGTSERLARSLVELAQAHGLAGIDHVVLSRRSGQTQSGENVFVIRGRLDDPAHQRVVMRTDDALDGSGR
ncbi:XVIPCD domain-containing protein [Silanimonas sp.]|uniref:XVIPCD domain-containing protein n=1 Tax=Silanimonas sp. TaxID=1929290 RepID=UPI0037C9280F